MTPTDLSIMFFLQMTVVIATCRLVGWVAHRFLGQPQVVGEMIAGVILGPSLFGLLAPELQSALFPKDSRSILFVGAQLGVGLYMFLVGLEFRGEHFRSQARSAAAISISGMAAPFAVAALISPWLLARGLFGEGIDGFQSFLFTGAAISITAFPMLARIIKERGLAGTPLGVLSLSAGAIDDAGAWTVLAIVLATFGGGPILAVKAILGGGLFVLFMLTLGRRLFAPLGDRVEREGGVSPAVLALVLILFMLAAFAMDAVGIHAVFGGFVLGCVMPRGRFATEVKAQLEPFTVIALLPMFFTYSGLNTRLDVVNSPELLQLTLAILVGSILAKGGACWAAARLTGHDNGTAMGVGALMNARGLMELIIINIGLQRGIIGGELFTMFVTMAIVTTLLASPLFELAYGRQVR